MNKMRRKEIYSVIKQLNYLIERLNNGDLQYFNDNIDSIIDLIQCIFDEEECCRDNIPENLQSGYRYQESDDACDNLYDAITELEDIYDNDNVTEISDGVSRVIDFLYNAT